MGPPTPFEIQESRQDGWLCLSLSGELDRAAAMILEGRLASLRVPRSPVRLDLSHLDFIDSSGIRLLIQTIGEARLKHWDVEIDPNLSPPVERLFRLVHLDRFVLGQTRTRA
ncbi:MAG TPA: STAS domain-containing protein [Solirubrobacteraceae bacterium]|nr:STAS domain-containing protein [Solirubrobacteraceae bacterium]